MNRFSGVGRKTGREDGHRNDLLEVQIAVKDNFDSLVHLVSSTDNY